MYISQTSWKNEITQRTLVGLIMFFLLLSFGSYIGKKWVILDKGVDIIHSCKLCVWCMNRGRIMQNAIGWAMFLPVFECWLCRLQLSTSWSMSYWSAANSAKKLCVSVYQNSGSSQNVKLLYLCDPLCLCERLFAKSDCQTRIMVIAIMVIYHSFCDWHYSRCISSFNLSNVSWVDIYHLNYNNLRRLNEYTQLQVFLSLIVLFYNLLDQVLELHCEIHHNIYNIPIKCKTVR